MAAVWFGLNQVLHHSGKIVKPCYSDMKASIPGSSNNLSEWLTEYAIGLAQQRRPQKKRNLAHRYSRGWGWCLDVEYMHSAEKVHDTALDDEN